MSTQDIKKDYSNMFVDLDQSYVRDAYQKWHRRRIEAREETSGPEHGGTMMKFLPRNAKHKRMVIGGQRVK